MYSEIPQVNIWKHHEYDSEIRQQMVENKQRKDLYRFMFSIGLVLGMFTAALLLY